MLRKLRTVPVEKMKEHTEGRGLSGDVFVAALHQVIKSGDAVPTVLFIISQPHYPHFWCEKQIRFLCFTVTANS